MTDTNIPETEEYRTELMDRASRLGIEVHPKAKNATIAAKIQAKLADDTDQAEMTVIDAKAEEKAGPVPVREVAGKKVHPALRLHRVTVSCNDPQKADQSGDMVSVSNGEVGDIRFYVHFNKPWHVPEIVLNTLREAKIFLHSSRRDGRDVVTREVPRYNIEVLPALSEVELKRIQDKQAAALASED